MVSGNENKIDLTSGVAAVVRDAAPDSLTFLDFSEFPPRVQHLPDLSNSVIGPPSGLYITEDGRHALVANRADGTISVLGIDGLRVAPLQTVEVCPPEVSLSDVAIHSGTGRVLASVQKGRIPG